MTDRPAPRAPWVLSYPGLRRSGGYLGIALPFALVLGQTVSNAFVTGHLSLAIQPSISAYYYTSMRNILVGDLCAIAVFLIACKGYSRFDAILGDLAPRAGSECLLLVNGFGGTPLMELYLMVNAARRILAGRGLKVVRHLTGSLVTSLDMAGCSLTVSLLDESLIRLWDAPVKTAALSW